MKIQESAKVNVYFSDLDFGDVFKYDGVYKIKLDDTSSALSFCPTGHMVDMADGVVKEVERDFLVEPVKGYFKVE